MLRTSNKIEIPTQLFIKKSSFYLFFPPQTLSLTSTSSHPRRNTWDRKIKVLRNMCGTNPLSHVNHLEEAQTLEERPSHRCVGSKVPWIITTLISTCLALFLFVIRTNPNCPSSSPVKDTFETGFSTDLGKVDQRIFAGIKRRLDICR